MIDTGANSVSAWLRMSAFSRPGFFCLRVVAAPGEGHPWMPRASRQPIQRGKPTPLVVPSQRLCPQNPNERLKVTEGEPPSGMFAVSVPSNVDSSTYSMSPVPASGLTVAERVRPAFRFVSYETS